MRSRALAGLAALALLGILANPVLGTGSGGVAGRVRASPIAISLTVSASSLKVGEQVIAVATVTNLTKTAVTGVLVDLRLDPTGLQIKPVGGQSMSLKAGKSADAKWSVCGVRAGSYVLVARATLNGVSIDSSARILTVTTVKRTC